MPPHFQPEIVLTDFAIKVLSGEEGRLEVVANIKNMSDSRIYSVLTPHCLITVNSVPLADFELRLDGTGSFNGKSSNIAIEGRYGAISDLNMGKGSRQIFSKIFNLTYDSIHKINEQYEKQGKRGKIPLLIEMTLPAVQSNNVNGQNVFEGVVVTRFNFEHYLDADDWNRWITSWGYQITTLTLPPDLLQMIRTEMKNRGYLQEWEVVYTAMRMLGNKTSDITVIRGESIKKRMIELMVNCKKNLYIAVQVVDTELKREIIDAVKRGVDVKLVIGVFDKKKLNQRDRRYVAIRDILPVAKIKLKEDYHGRMIIADDIVIIGSADVDSQGLQVHDNIVIQTNDLVVLQSAKQIFEDLFSKSPDLITDSS